MDVIPIEVEYCGEGYRLQLCRQLEQGNILILDPTPFLPSEEDCAFLRRQQQSQRATHKNIAYKPHLQRTTGVGEIDTGDQERLKAILARYSDRALGLLSALFPVYAAHWRVDYASFRPVEEEGRILPLRHRNDLLHLDAFPTRPTHGARILRAFTNLHPTKERVWATSDSFSTLAERYAVPAGLKRVTGPLAILQRSAATVARLTGAPLVDRSPYDQFMLNFHHYLKANTAFQREGRKHRFAFAPGATWITFTDQVAHAVISGQYALEQTCIVPREAMAQPELAPISVLERLAGRPLANTLQRSRAASPASA